MADCLRANRARRCFFQQRRATLHFQQHSIRVGRSGERPEDLSGRCEIEKTGGVIETAETIAKQPVATKPTESITTTAVAAAKVRRATEPAAIAKRSVVTGTGSARAIPDATTKEQPPDSW